MFLFHLAFAVSLLALTAGLFLFAWAIRLKDGVGVGLTKLLGAIVVILAVGNLICVSYTGAKLKKEGFFLSPMTMSAMTSMKMQNQMAADKATVEKTKTKEKTKHQ